MTHSRTATITLAYTQMHIPNSTISMHLYGGLFFMTICSISAIIKQWSHKAQTFLHPIYSNCPTNETGIKQPPRLMDMAVAYQHIKTLDNGQTATRKVLEDKHTHDLSSWQRLQSGCVGSQWQKYEICQRDTALAELAQQQATILATKDITTHEFDTFKRFHEEVVDTMHVYQNTLSSATLFLEFDFISKCLKYYPDINIATIPGMEAWIARFQEPGHIATFKLYVCGLCSHTQDGLRGNCSQCGGCLVTHNPTHFADDMCLDVGGSVVYNNHSNDVGSRSATGLVQPLCSSSGVLPQQPQRTRGRPKLHANSTRGAHKTRTTNVDNGQRQTIQRDDLLPVVRDTRGYKKIYTQSVRKMWSAICAQAAQARVMLCDTGNGDMLDVLPTHALMSPYDVYAFHWSRLSTFKNTEDVAFVVMLIVNATDTSPNHRSTLSGITNKVFRYFNQICAVVKRTEGDNSAVVPFHPLYLIFRILGVIGYVCHAQDYKLCEVLIGEALMRLSETTFEAICSRLKWPFIIWSNLNIGTTMKLKSGGGGLLNATYTPKTNKTVFIPTISRRVSPLEYVGLA